MYRFDEDIIMEMLEEKIKEKLKEKEDKRISRSESGILLSIALGHDKRNWEDINKRFEEDKETYLELYNTMFSDVLDVFDRFTFERAEMIKRMFLILVLDESQERFLFSNRLIKKTYKPALTYFNTKTHIDLKEFTYWYVKRAGGVEKVSGIYLDFCYYVLVYLCIRDGKTMEDSTMYETVVKHLDELSMEDSLGLDDSSVYDELGNITGYNELIEKLVVDVDPKDTRVADIFENIKLKDGLDSMRNATGILRLTRAESIAERYSSNFKEFIDDFDSNKKKMFGTRLTNTLYTLIEIMGVDPSFLRDYSINGEQMNSIAKMLKLIQNEYEGTNRESEILFLVSLVLYALTSEYKSLKNVHYKALNKDTHERVKKYKEEIEQITNQHIHEKDEFKRELNKVSIRMNEIASILKAREKTILEQERELKRLRKELEVKNEQDKELAFLREYYFDNEEKKSEYNKEKDMTSDMLNYLLDIDGAIVGGHIRSLNKVKEMLPNFDIVTDVEVSRDVNFLKNKQIVFYNHNYNNHSLYYKVKEAIKNTNTKLVYLTNHQNLDLLLGFIYDKCKDHNLK